MIEQLTNELHRGALTIGMVKVGDKILVWQPGISESRREYTVIDAEPFEADGAMSLEVETPDGRKVVIPTGSLGLTPDRYGGWTHIAILSDSED